VIVSQLLNERFAHEAGLVDGQLGLGHAFEINPALPESLRLELAYAQLAEGIVTPFLSDRDLALENVRHVLGAAGGLAEDFRPEPDGSSRPGPAGAVSHAHHDGSLVDGAYVLGMFGDVATGLCIRTDGDEGLSAGYASVAFEASARAGDVLEATAEVVRVGTRSREVEFTARVLCRAAPERSASAADVLPEPVVVVRARGTVVVPLSG